MSYPDFRRDRLATFIPPRFYLAALVTIILFIAWLLKPEPETARFGITAGIGTLSGLVYWRLFKQNNYRLAAFLFAPADFILLTAGVASTHWAVGGLMMFYPYCIITSAMVLRPAMALWIGALSIGVAGIGWLQRTPVATSMPPSTFELFNSLGFVVVSALTYLLMKKFDETMVKQEALQHRLEGERDRLDIEVARRTEELVRANRALDNRNTMLALQRRQAEEANRLKSQFLASMSHELRTPLNAINGFADLMLQGIYGAVTPKQQERLGNIMSRAKDLLTLINGVLDLAKVESGRIELEFSQFDPGEVVEEVIQSLEPVVRNKGQGVRVAFERLSPARLITSDRERYRQIVSNLLTNALTFTEQGTVSVILEEGAEGQLITTVRDTGIGIRREDQEKIFEPFQQLEGGPTRRYGGMGLGLYICRQLATLLRGRIEVASELRQGSQFTVVLPIESPQEMHEHMLRVIGPTDLDSAGHLTQEALNRQVTELSAQVRQANQQLRGIFDCSPFPMLVYGPHGTILLWNRACEALAQTPGMIALKSTLQEALYPGDETEVLRLLELTFSGFTCRLGWRGLDADGNNLLRVGFHYPVLHEHGGVSYVVGMLIEPGPHPVDESVQVLERADEFAFSGAGRIAVGGSRHG